MQGWIPSYIVQLDFSAAFDRLNHSGLLFKLKSIGVGGSLLSICREFLSNLRKRVVADSATSQWSGFQSFLAYHREVCWVLFCSSFIPVECFSWWRTDCMLMLILCSDAKAANATTGVQCGARCAITGAPY